MGVEIVFNASLGIPAVVALEDDCRAQAASCLAAEDILLPAVEICKIAHEIGMDISHH
jgi:hypothetical protein